MLTNSMHSTSKCVHSKISQHENDDTYVAEDYFYTKFSLFIRHVFVHTSA